MNEQIKDIAVRAAKTFFQAFLATASLQLASLSAGRIEKIDLPAIMYTVCLSALAAGISALQNTLFPPIKGDKDGEQ